ncbi:hypothetical protein AMS68_002728 [Peltaster fructicola]|uniref:MARVEL domain-containing protein n=1 Tax=Peltaster fructicola TaxID=286661 RepID=A0A6H0XRC8_9PEZI|nr:hypothetical protein AMS68_002728 [Peltaster fructicola]
MLIPPVGMLAWFVNGYVSNNQLTPNFVLVLFIATVLALVWATVTLFNYLRARHDALFVALVDLGFCAALIAGVVVLRFISNANCNDYTSDSSFNSNLGVFWYGYYTNNSWGSNPNKTCSMLKASFAFGIIDIILFFTTFLLALLVHRNHRDDNKVIVRREYHSSRHSHRRSSSRDPRASSREYRGSRDYDYDRRPRSNSGQVRRSSSRRPYQV